MTSDSGFEGARPSTWNRQLSLSLSCLLACLRANFFSLSLSLSLSQTGDPKTMELLSARPLTAAYAPNPGPLGPGLDNVHRILQLLGERPSFTGSELRDQ